MPAFTPMPKSVSEEQDSLDAQAAELVCDMGNGVAVDGVLIDNTDVESVEREAAEGREDAEDWDEAEFVEDVESEIDVEGSEDVAASWREVVPSDGAPMVVDAAKAASSSANEGPAKVSVLGTEQSKVPSP